MLTKERHKIMKLRMVKKGLMKNGLRDFSVFTINTL